MPSRVPILAAVAAWALLPLPPLRAEARAGEPLPEATPSADPPASGPRPSAGKSQTPHGPQSTPPGETKEKAPPERPRRGRRAKEPGPAPEPIGNFARQGLAPATVELSSLPDVLYRGETLDYWIRGENRTAKTIQGALGIRLVGPGGRELFSGRESVWIPPAQEVPLSHPSDREDRRKYQILIDEVRDLGGEGEGRDPPLPIAARSLSARFRVRLDLAKGEAAELTAFLESDGRVLSSCRSRLRPIESGLGGLAFDAGRLRDPDGTPVSIVCDLEDPMVREEWKPIRLAWKALSREAGFRIAVYAEDLRAPDGTSLEKILAGRATGGRTLAFVPATPGPRPVARDLPAIEKALESRPEVLLLILPRGAPESPVEPWEVSRALHVAVERARAAGARVILAGPVPAPGPDRTGARAAIARASAAEHDAGLLDLSKALPEGDLPRLYASPMGDATLRDPGPEGLKRLADAIEARAWR